MLSTGNLDFVAANKVVTWRWWTQFWQFAKSWASNVGKLRGRGFAEVAVHVTLVMKEHLMTGLPHTDRGLNGDPRRLLPLLAEPRHCGKSWKFYELSIWHDERFLSRVSFRLQSEGKSISLTLLMPILTGTVPGPVQPVFWRGNFLIPCFSDRQNFLRRFKKNLVMTFFREIFSEWTISQYMSEV